MKRKILLICSIIFVLLFVAAIVIYQKFFAKTFVTKDNSEFASLYIPTNASFSEMQDSLVKLGLDDTASFATLANFMKFKTPKAGFYKIKNNSSYISIVRSLRSGNQTPIKLTFNNLRKLSQLAGLLGNTFEADSVAFMQSFENVEMLDSLSFDFQQLPALFLPNTYEFYWNTSPENFLEKMHKEYNKFWNDERKKLAERLSLSPIDVSILASIIEEETNNYAEMPMIAGVYKNRLDKGMLLQACPTLKFALDDFSLRRILKIHTEVESPYNTYQNLGLPPGPIRIPSIRAIDAVLNCTRHDYLYFCASADMSGKHKFARTLAQHNQNAAEYQAELNRRKIYK